MPTHARTNFGLLFLMLAGTVVHDANGQDSRPAPPEPFETRFGGEGKACGNAVLELPDGGFIVCGYSETDPRRRVDVLVARFNERGETVWQHVYGEADNDHGWDIVRTAAGEFVVLGYTEGDHVGNEDALLMKIGADGEELWRKTYGGPAGERAWSMVQMPDGDITFVAQTQSFGAGDWDVMVIRTDPAGEERWRTLIGGPGLDRAFSIDATPNGDVIVAGMQREPDREDLDVLVARISGTGDVVWQRSYGGEKNDIGHGVLALAEGGFLVTGYGESHSAGGADMYAIRLDDDGEVVWWRNHGGLLSERAMMSERLADGTFVATGYTQIAGEREWDAALWALGPDGILIGSTMLTNTGYDRGVMVRELRGGGLVITGSFGDPRSPAFEAFLVRRARPE